MGRWAAARLFAKRQSLAFFSEVHGYSGMEKHPMASPGRGVDLQFNRVVGPRRRSLDLAPLAWDRETLDDLSKAADEWLDSQVRY